MFLQVKRSKIQAATVTETNSNYTGCITIDEVLLEAANIYEGERVQVLNITSGEWMETHVMKGERDSGIIGINGTAIGNIGEGDKVIIISYAFVTPDELQDLRTINIFPDDNNKII